MGKTTGIEWTDSTWNPIRGCSRVSEGCRNCYAEAVAARFSGVGQAYQGLARFVAIDQGKATERLEPRWTGDVRLIEKALLLPLSWKEPRKIFVNSMSDLFHPGVRDEWLAEIFEAMARAPQHVYQILTKRPDRMFEALEAASASHVAEAFEQTHGQPWPPPNWWFGVSVEDQATATYRIPILEKCQAAVLFVSYEPALGPIDWYKTAGAEWIDWLICGGESGPRARPMHPDWARSSLQFCQDRIIPFFFKQWGAWSPCTDEFLASKKQSVEALLVKATEKCGYYCDPEGPGHVDHGDVPMARVGKHLAGAHLDGVEWKEFPNVEHVAFA